MRRSTRAGWWSALILLTGLGGCAKFSPDSGMGFVDANAGAELRKDVVKIRTEEEAAATAARVAGLLRKPLSDETAVQIALLNNRTLQAAYSELGVSEAQMVEASLPPAPTFSLSRLVATGELEIERQILQNVLGLLTLPRRREIAEAKFQQAKVRAVEATLKTAADARRAYYRAVAANRIVAFLEQSRTAADALSELARKLGETGALSKLDQAREHAFTADVNGQLALARLRQRAERERLIRALGLWAQQTAVRLPGDLRALPAAPKVFKDIETIAVRRRVDLEMARQDLDILARKYGLTRATRFIDVLEVRGISRTERTTVERTAYTLNQGPPPSLSSSTEKERERAQWTGVELEFQIPIYDFGEARTRQAEETYMGAVHRLIARAVDVRSEAREAYAGYRGAYDVAKHYQNEIVPLRQIINDEMLLNYNGMLRDLFTLLTESKARIQANVQAIEARRDFWLAQVDLHVAVVGGGAMVGSSASVSSGASPEPGGH
ncbi:MAG: TolC family protein [Hyphomicrobiales bacterium]|nr:MAG: TolC family protein [Hyphomicrobiales bacterium]